MKIVLALVLALVVIRYSIIVVIDNFWNCHCGFLSNLYSGICNLFLVELLLTVIYAEKYEVHSGKSRLL